MTMMPPPLAARLLELALPAPDRDAVIGDLHEEFCAYILPSRGWRRARWWYRWQVARSLTPLLFRSWERASVSRAVSALLGGAMLATLPATAMLALRSFVLQQVPLKTTADVSPGFALALLVVVALATAAGFVLAVRVLHTKPCQR